MIKPDSSFPIFIVENLAASKSFYLDLVQAVEPSEEYKQGYTAE